MLLLSFGFVLFVRHNVQRAVEESARQLTQSSGVSFSLTPLTANSAVPGLQSFGIHGAFQAFVLYEGDWMVCNRSTLFRYDRQGQLRQSWRVGLELPPTPLTGLAVRRGIPQPELWVATDGAGSLIWDGTTFRQLLPGSAPLRKQTSLLALPDGRMLVGTRTAGLYITDTRQFSLFRSELGNAEVTALASGTTAGEIWIGTRAQGVWLWRAGTFSHFLTELPDQQVLSIFGDDAGVWVGTVNGVAEFVDGSFRRRLAEGVLATALARSANRLWISTVDQGIETVDLKMHAPRPSAGMNHDESHPLHAAALLPMKDGVAALGDSQISLLPERRDLLMSDSTGLTNGHITALNIDRQRRLWIGYFNRGLDLLVDGNVRHWDDDALFCVNRIKFDPDGSRVFVATANGLALFDMNGKLRQVVRVSDGLISDHVSDVLSLPTGQGTVVATSAGLTYMNGAAASSVYAFQGLVNNHVYTVAQAGPSVMAGTLGGISVLKNAVVQNSFTTANSNLSQNWITASVVVGDDVFLGTYGSGVIRLNAHYDVQGFREFSNNRVEINANAMITTSHGVYAGTAGQGLAFLPKGEIRWRFWKAGLPSANVTALAADENNIYIGTDNGLVRVPERDITI